MQPARRLREALVGYHHRAIHKPRVERVSRALVDLIGRARSVLDVGCGDGTVALSIAREVGASRVEGVDIKVRPETAIPVAAYDGKRLPFPDGSFEAVIISDVLHHCPEPRVMLRECLRVSSRLVAVKDHFCFGKVSWAILLAMDVVGNAGPGVHVEGVYLSPAEWVALCRDAGGRFTALTWPLQIHDYPFRWITQDRLQFAARIERV